MPAVAFRLVLAASLLSVVTACGASAPGHVAARSSPTSGASAAAAAPTPMPSPILVDGNKIQDHGSRTVTGLTSTTMQVSDFYFSPSVLVGSPGQRLTLHLHNVGQAEHTFTISAQNVNAVLDPGQTATVTVTFPRHGTLPFLCQYHVGAGMAGLLETP